MNSTPQFPLWFGSIARGAVIAVGLAFVFSWFGVYDTANQPFLTRMTMWLLTITTGIASSAVIMPFVYEGRFGGPFATLHWTLQTLIAAALVSVPVTLALLLVLVWQNDAPPLREWGFQYGYVVAVSLVLTGLAYGYSQFQKSREELASVSGGSTSGPPPLAQRLPVRLRSAEIWAVSAEDHYLRVHTSAGEELILLRLADAIRELAGLEGLQTHRSWWVARAGLADVQKGDGKLVLKLKSGTEAPVSRTYVKAVREAGWS